MDDVQELAKHFANAGAGIPAGGIGSRYDNTLDGSVFFALISDIMFQILDEFLIIQIFRIAHIQELHNSARNFTKLLVFQSHLNFNIGDILIGEKIGSEGMVSWFCYGLLQT